MQFNHKSGARDENSVRNLLNRIGPSYVRRDVPLNDTYSHNKLDTNLNCPQTSSGLKFPAGSVLRTTCAKAQLAYDQGVARLWFIALLPLIHYRGYPNIDGRYTLFRSRPRSFDFQLVTK